MDEKLRSEYERIRAGETGFYEQPRGLIAVWGKEAVPFLDGMITNDMKTLEDGQEMLAAFPNAQGRLLAVVRVLRQGNRFLFETEAATREKVFQNLFRFTFAGDFFVEDLSENYRYFEIMSNFRSRSSDPEFDISDLRSEILNFGGTKFEGRTLGIFVSADAAERFRQELTEKDFVTVSDKVHETLRIENGIPRYGIDMDETTIVPELGLDGLISYNKGCYIGQEIIARIHFRGHVAKRLTGLILDGTRTSLSASMADMDVRVPSDGKNAGRITSVTYSPKLEKTIALAFVRYDYLAAGTVLSAGDTLATVTDLPFIV